MSKFATASLGAALAGALMLGGCASYTGQTSDPNDPNRTRTGALVGAGIGAVAGLLSGSDATERRQHAMIGAGAGALAGGAVGAYQDRQEAELRRRMAGTGVDVHRDGDNITLNMPGAITFGCSASRVNPAPRFCSTTPVSGSTSPDPNVEKRLWIQLTILPSPSATVRYTVSPWPSGAPGSGHSARSPSMSARRSRV